jgi:hypothetical protein
VGLLGLVLLAGKKAVFSRVMSDADLLQFKLGLPTLLPEILPPYVVENRKLMDLLRRFIAPEPKDRFPDALTAESDAQGLRMVHKQLTLSGKDSDYGRDVSAFINAVQLGFWDTITLKL